METNMNDLPKTWRRTKIGTLCKLVGGFAFKSSNYLGMIADLAPEIAQSRNQVKRLFMFSS